MVKCDYFTTNIVELEGSTERELESIDSFVLYICAEGEADVCMGDNKEHLEPFDLVMIPAEADSVKLCGNAKLLEVYIE
jgi:mannose-6-phosphate isomerase